MKKMKLLVPVMLVLCLVMGWVSFMGGSVADLRALNDYMDLAEQSREAGLYEQAVEYYKKAYQYDKSDKIYELIKDVYDVLYEEEHTTFIRNLYIADMEEAASRHPQNQLFWERQIQLHMEAGNYSKAYKTARDAVNRNIGGDEIDRLYRELLYMTKLDYRLYYDFDMALNGYISVNDGGKWLVLDEKGTAVTSGYSYVGLINDDGKGMFVGNIDTRILDGNEIPRARFPFEPQEAGYYNENCGLIPVRIGEVWSYLNVESGAWLAEGYTAAGSFYGEEAVACRGTQWVLVNVSGTEKVLDTLTDVKLDLYGCHLQNGVILAKSAEDGKYHIYDESFSMVGSFAADDIDLCIDSTGIAFAQNGKWGFVNNKGEVLVEPQYARAKSFANGYAAVCDDNGLWGFIDDDYKLVIDYAFADAFYFTASETCMVSTKDDTYQMLHFMFE